MNEKKGNQINGNNSNNSNNNNQVTSNLHPFEPEYLSLSPVPGPTSSTSASSSNNISHHPSNGSRSSPNSVSSSVVGGGGAEAPFPDTITMSIGSSNSNNGYNNGVSSQQASPQPRYPPNHPLSGSKHLCSICGDRASGKHYGVYSCEGCKGFFKRTVRKDLTYACREERNCIVDKRQRNRCQYCRYQKCLMMGMKREAVQEERQRNKDKNENEVESTSNNNNNNDMPIDRILDSELRVEPKGEEVDANDPVSNLCHAADRQLYQLVEWAKHIPHFTELPLDDQVALLKSGWNELLIAGFSHRSMNVKDGIMLAPGLIVNRSNATISGVGAIFDRVLTELVAKMREIKMDKTELGCLRAIVLYNPESLRLKSMSQVEALREKVYAVLEEYCKQNYPEQPGRFAKLLLRLPALRSIGLKCVEHLFLYKMIGNTPIDGFLLSLLENSSDG